MINCVLSSYDNFTSIMDHYGNYFVQPVGFGDSSSTNAGSLSTAAAAGLIDGQGNNVQSANSAGIQLMDNAGYQSYLPYITSSAVGGPNGYTYHHTGTNVSSACGFRGFSAQPTFTGCSYRGTDPLQAFLNPGKQVLRFSLQTSAKTDTFFVSSGRYRSVSFS